jgi:uncharacterized repeat protein (TIGR01451 family)
MKRTSLLLAVLLLIGFAAQSFAAGTPAGTMISNQATGTYNDGSGNPMPGVSSNIVQTRVAENPGVTITSPADQNVANESFVTYALTITNTGNFTDTYDLGLTNTDDVKFSVALYEDTDGDGVLDDDEDDTEITETDAVAADGEYDIIVKVTNVSAAQGNQTTTQVAATSQYDAGTSTSDSFVSTATLAAISGSLDADQVSYNPGEVITYTVDFDNNGNETAYSTVTTLHIPAKTTYVPNSTYLGAAQQVDGTTWSGGTGTINVGNVAASGNVVITFQVTVNNDATGTISDAAEIDYDNSQGTAYTQVELSEDVTVTRTYGVDASTPDGDKAGTGGNDVLYSIEVENTGNGTDNYNLSASHDSSWTWEYYYDLDGDGVIDGGETQLTDTDGDLTIDTGDIESGDSKFVIAKVTIPGGTPDVAQDETTVTFTSDDGSTSDSVVLTTDVDAPFLSLVKSVSPSGDQPPGTELTYTVVVTNSGSANAGTVVITDPIPANTTYKAGSLTIDTVSKTDAADADEASCVAGTATFNLGTVDTTTPVSISFTVTIN